MPRFPRNYVQASFFHIIVQGIKKEYIFNKKCCIEKYINLMSLKIYKDIDIIAYCIMNNHAHILVRVEKIDTMKQWMHKVNTSYAVYYNKYYKRVGYVFRNRYKSQVIINEKHLYNCVNYIHNNPINAHICNKPELYEYSSLKRMYKGNTSNVYKRISEILNKTNISYNCKVDKISKVEEMSFLECDIDKEEVCKNVVLNFTREYKIDIEDIVKDKKHLKELVQTLKFDYNISYRKMEKVLHVSREKLRKL